MRYGLLGSLLWAQVFSIHGEVRTPSGEALSHVIIRLPQTGYQTVSSADGRFTVNAALDTIILELRHLGYRTLRDTLYRSDGRTAYTFTLYPQEVRLGGVIITEGGKDPGELLIRRAIAAKARNRSCLSSFRTETYTLFTLRWLEPPGALLQRLTNRALADREVLYMSETFSHIYFVAPDKYREEIVRSRVVGTQQYSFIGGWIFQGFDPYGERLSLSEITETPFILPLAQDAPLHYRYRLMGSFWEEDGFFYKIAVEPRSRQSPCVEGYVVLADESYALVGLEWQVKAPRPIRYTDSIGVRATWVPVGGCYLLGELSFKGHFRVSLPVGSLAFVGEGYAAYRKYQALLQQKQKPEPPKKSTSAAGQVVPASTDSLIRPAPAAIETLRVERLDFGEFVRILPDAAEAPAAFWDSLRQAPLDSTQLAYIGQHDSMIAQRETTAVRRRGQLAITGIGAGWTRFYQVREGYARTALSLQLTGYTPLEGWVIPLTARYERSGKRAGISFRVSGRYGTGWRRILPIAAAEWSGQQYPQWRWRLAGGMDIREPTDFVQVPILWNALYRAVGQVTPWQGYERSFVEVSLRRYLHRTTEAEVRLSRDRRATGPERETFYEATRTAAWLYWRPGTRTFTTPRSTRFIPPEGVFTTEIRFGAEVAWLRTAPLFSMCASLDARLSISPLGRIETQLGGAWQNHPAPWADRLYIPTAALIFHRSYSDFVKWAPYESPGTWTTSGILGWLPEGSLLRLLPVLRRTSWQEALVLRALYTESAGWHLEGSLFLHQLNLRLRKTGLARPLSIGFHSGFIGRTRSGAITVAIGDILSPLSLPKPARP